jgi:hypothetical protein
MTAKERREGRSPVRGPSPPSIKTLEGVWAMGRGTTAWDVRQPRPRFSGGPIPLQGEPGAAARTIVWPARSLAFAYPRLSSL